MSDDLLRAVIGLTEAEAVSLVAAAGLDPVPVEPDTAAVTMDYRPGRVRLFLDEARRVTRATSG